MIHTVFFWLKNDLSEADRTTFATELRKLLDIGEIQRGQVGTPAQTPERPVTDKSFSHSLHLEFASAADHDIYQDHAAHHAFVDTCKAMWDKVVVYDTETH